MLSGNKSKEGSSTEGDAEGDAGGNSPPAPKPPAKGAPFEGTYDQVCPPALFFTSSRPWVKLHASGWEVGAV